MTKKILICGGTGFIGRNLALRFAQDPSFQVSATYHRTLPFDHPNIRWVRADLTTPNDVKKICEGAETLVQAAATTSGVHDIVNTPQLHVTDNAIMNSLLFREAHEQRIKHLVFFSCSVFYGDRPEGVREDDFDANETMHPRYFGVGWTKIYLEKMAEFYSRLGNTRFSVVRHSNVYGPWDKFDLKRSHVFGATMAKVLTATDQVTVWGDGNESRDLLFVSDLIDFVERVLKKQESAFDLTHVGLGRAVTIRELVHKMIACSGKQLEVNYDPSKPTIPVRLFLDTTRAQTLYGWTPRVTLDDGIEKTMEWVRNHLVLT